MTSNVMAKAKTPSVNPSSRLLGMEPAASSFEPDKLAPSAARDSREPFVILGPNSRPGQLPLLSLARGLLKPGLDGVEQLEAQRAVGLERDDEAHAAATLRVGIARERADAGHRPG